jgi:two-component system sensor histidine kinase QseC
MSPLEKLARQIGRFSEDDLAARIDLDAPPLEIQPVVDRLNDLLRRLEDAFRRERAFSANVAHELRNPLAGLRLKMDVATSRTRQPPEYERAIDDCRRITAQMQTMVENLLALARIEAGQVQVRRESLLLDRLVRELWEPLEAEAAGRLLNVLWSREEEVPIVSDPSLLRVVLRNVLENAVAYADQGGTVRIEARSVDHQARLSVSNSGSRLSQDQAESVFQQFWRGDEARSQAGAHCGLGLSLVRKIAGVLGGTAVARCNKDGDFELVLSIPARANDAPA